MSVPTPRSELTAMQRLTACAGPMWRVSSPSSRPVRLWPVVCTIQLQSRLAALPGDPRSVDADYGCTGPMLESHPAEGETPSFKGSMMLAVAENEAEVRKILENDIYHRTGVWDLENAQIIAVCVAVSPVSSIVSCVLLICCVYIVQVCCAPAAMIYRHNTNRIRFDCIA